MTASALGIYLRNHDAAAGAGIDLCRRAAHNQRGRPHASALESLCRAVQDDRQHLRMIMRAVNVGPNPLLEVALKVGERLGRLKPNGRLVRRAPLSDLVEIEGLIDAVGAKQGGWHALAAASLPTEEARQVAQLIHRADDQLAQLRLIHTALAAEILPERK